MNPYLFLENQLIRVTGKILSAKERGGKEGEKGVLRKGGGGGQGSLQGVRGVEHIFDK